jgi:hypothetical protein
MKIFKKTHIANGTTSLVGVVVSDKPCTLRYVTVNTKANGATTIYDLGVETATTNVVGVLAANVPEQTFTYDCVMSNGIRVDTNAAVDLTVCYEY